MKGGECVVRPGGSMAGGRWMKEEEKMEETIKEGEEGGVAGRK